MENETSFQIPALPEVARKALVHLYKSDPEIAILVRILSSDPGLSSDIFRLANSAFLGSTNPTSDLKSAIGRIGLTTLRQIVMLTAMSSAYKLDFGGIINVSEFWRHGAFVGQVAYNIAKKIKNKNADELQIVGLLHDIGIVFVHYNSPEQLRKTVAECHKSGTDLASVERSLELQSHANFGALVLEQWQLSDKMQLYVSLHDTPASDLKQLPQEDQEALVILRLADTLAHRNGFGFSGYTRATAIDGQTLNQLGISASDLRNITTHCVDFLKMFQ